MRRQLLCWSIGLLIAAHSFASSEQGPYKVAYAGFGPINGGIFVANADGHGARPIASHPRHDANAAFFPDGRSIVFTSWRNGSADIYRVQVDGGGLERLTDHPAYDDQAVVSPDGSRVAFVSSRSGQADIWLLDLRKRTLQNLTNHPAGDFRPAWSPDGIRIAFSSDRDSRRQKGGLGFSLRHSTELYVMNADGSSVKRLTHDQAFAGSPRWSGDGETVVFYQGPPEQIDHIISVNPQRGTTQIASINVNSGEVRTLTSAVGEKWSPQVVRGQRTAYTTLEGIEFVGGPSGARGEFWSPSWSPDGERVVFHREMNPRWPPVREEFSPDRRFRLLRTGIFPSFTPDGKRLISGSERGAILQNAILSMNLDGSDRRIVFSDAEQNPVAPALSPLGDRIAFGLGTFFRGARGAAGLAIIGTEGRDFQKLQMEDGNHGFPSWSPDGRRLVYRSATANGKGLSIIDLASGAITKLTSGPFNDNFPSWSPRGDLIAFTTDRDGDWELYVIRQDGTGLKRLTNSPGNDAHCSWSPDGEWIAFSSGRQGFKDEAALYPQNGQPYGEIHVMRADGSEVVALTDDPFEDATPAFASLPRKQP